MRVLSLVVLALFLVLPCFAVCTAEQWRTDLALYQRYLTAEPKDYLAAINLNRKWIKYGQDDPAALAAATGGTTAGQLQANLNNVYREVARILVTDYTAKLQSDPLQAAQLGVNVQTFFRENPAILREFAAANGSTAAAMQVNLLGAIRTGFLATWKAMAQEYSQLVKAGKTAEAEQMSASWNSVISDLEAHGSRLPEQFRRFTGVDVAAVVNDLKAFEADYAAYHAAIRRGDFAAALALVDKWDAYSATDPRKADAINFIWNASSGAAPRDRAAWAKAWNEVRAQVYAEMFKADTRAYEAAIAGGRLDEAKALIAKWKDLVQGPLGEAIAAKFGLDARTFLGKLDQEKLTLDGVDPAVASESVASFRQDLAEYERCVEAFRNGEAGSDAWYTNIARAAELADKWSVIARQNPALAAQIKTATGIELPRAADDVIGVALDTALTDSAAKFNSLLATGQFAAARQLVQNWLTYLDKHPRVKEISIEKYGADFPATLERYERGLAIMAGDTSAGTGDEAGTTGTTGTADTAIATATVPAAGIDTSGSGAGLGASGQ